jgi:hypothetical protein
MVAKKNLFYAARRELFSSGWVFSYLPKPIIKPSTAIFWLRLSIAKFRKYMKFDYCIEDRGVFMRDSNSGRRSVEVFG